MVSVSLEAARALEASGLRVRVISMVSIKPIDAAAIISASRETGALVAVEDHNRYGGLGSAVAEVLSLFAPAPLEQVAMADTFAESGETDEALRQEYGLASQDVVAAVLRCVERKRAGAGRRG